MESIPYDKRSGKIWFNNELVEWQDTKVHVISHGMHYASLVFEGLRVYNKNLNLVQDQSQKDLGFYLDLYLYLLAMPYFYFLS